MRQPSTNKRQSTSWHSVNEWYGNIVGEKGHYYHQHIILPKLIDLFALTPSSRLLDLGSGEGILERSVPKEIEYLGIDIAEGLIKQARQKSTAPHHRFQLANISRPMQIEKSFTHAACILALQNMKDGKQCIANASAALSKDGIFIIVLNHPCFRIPRQSSWEIDPKNKLQYRRVNRYLSPMEIPINMTPGQKQIKQTWSFHHPLSTYFQWLKESGFVVSDCQEWSSDKESEGKAARMENRARSDFPLFMCIVAKKI